MNTTLVNTLLDKNRSLQVDLTVHCNRDFFFKTTQADDNTVKTLQHELASAEELLTHTCARAHAHTHTQTDSHSHTLPHAQTAPDWLINRQAGPSKGGRNPHQPCLLEEKSDTASQASAWVAAVHSGCITIALNFLSQN